MSDEIEAEDAKNYDRGGGPSQSACSPKIYRSSSFVLSDAMDAADTMRLAAQNYAPESRADFYRAIADEVTRLISEAENT